MQSAKTRQGTDCDSYHELLIAKFRFKLKIGKTLGFPGGASGKESARQCRRHKSHRLDSWVRKICWRRAWQPTPVFLPGESHGQRSLVGYGP